MIKPAPVAAVGDRATLVFSCHCVADTSLPTVRPEVTRVPLSPVSSTCAVEKVSPCLLMAPRATRLSSAIPVAEFGSNAE
ncbi:hypothetical protein D3C86_1595630 [compost metagenome]